MGDLMNIGYLSVETFIGERLSPVSGARVVIKCSKGNEIHEIFTNEKGLSEKVPLLAIDQDTTRMGFDLEGLSQTHNRRYTVTVTSKRGFRKTIVHGVEIFPGIASVLPVRKYPDPYGDAEPHEIFIPERLGTDLYESSQSKKFMVQGLLRGVSLSKLVVPSHITVHMGSPNESAERLVVPFKQYIKNIASSGNSPTLESAALGANILIQMSVALEKISSRSYRGNGYDFDITSSIEHDQAFIKDRNIFNNVSGIVDELWGLHIMAKDEPVEVPVFDDAWQYSARALAIRGYNPAQIVNYLCPGVQLVVFEEAGEANFTEPDCAEDVISSASIEAVATESSMDEEAEMSVESQSSIKSVNPAALMALGMLRRRWY